MSKEKQIISKLIKIANNQQTILQRLAQQATDPNASDPNVLYLQRAVSVAASNSGFIATDVQAAPVWGGPGTSVSYSVSLKGAPKDNKIRQQFITTFRAQLAAQKPDLAPSVVVKFGD